MPWIISAVNNFFSYDFIRNGFIAGTLAALVCGIIGYFVVLRGQNFAGHALSHIGFAGAAGAGLIGLSPITGQFILMLLAGIAMGGLGERTAKSDVAIAITLAFSLGLGVLFLHFYSNYAGHTVAILFGDLFGVSIPLIKQLLIYSIVCLGGLAIIGKRLLFASLEPELAQAKGISLSLLAMVFFTLVAVAIIEASQVVGILLVLTLLVGPAASALCVARTFWKGISLSVWLSICIVWVGILLAYLTDWPVTFWISTLSFSTYIGFKQLSTV